MIYMKNMKKLPITDKFLWKLYDLIEKADDVVDFIGPETMSETVYPDTRRLRHEYKKENARRKFSQFMMYLQNRGYVKTKALEGTTGVLLTPKGKKKVLLTKRKFGEKKKRKDGSWIMVIFDIPAKLGTIRHVLRDRLRWLGYQQLQKSVWVCPYDTHRETEEIIRELRLTSYVKIFFIKEII